MVVGRRDVACCRLHGSLTLLPIVLRAEAAHLKAVPDTILFDVGFGDYRVGSSWIKEKGDAAPRFENELHESGRLDLKLPANPNAEFIAL